MRKADIDSRKIEVYWRIMDSKKVRRGGRGKAGGKAGKKAKKGKK